MSPKVSLQTSKLPEALAAAVKANIDDWRAGDKVRRLWQRDASLWTGTDEANGWAGSTSPTSRSPTATTCRQLWPTMSRTASFTDILLLGMGGSSLCPEVLRDDLRQDRRLSRTARARLHRSGAGQGVREQGRSGKDAVHRFQQVRHHARAQYLQAILLRTGKADGRRGQGRQPLHRHHRSRLEDAAGGRGRSLPPYLSRPAQHRRTLLRALELRHGARRAAWGWTSSKFLARTAGNGRGLRSRVSP